MVGNIDAADESGIEHAGILTAFADAVVKGPDSDVEAARDAVATAIGFEAMVDAACVIANFQRMNRIADAMGIELDAPVRALSSDLRDSLGLDKFTSAENTKPTAGVMKIVSKLVFPLALKFYKPPMSGK